MKSDFISFWEYDTFLKNVDLVIVGSGIVGLTSAYFYKQKYSNKKVLVVESGVLPHGATTRNAGFACFGSISEILDDLTEMDEESCFLLVKERFEGLKALLQLHGKEALDYKACGGYEVFFDGDEELFEYCLSKMDYINTSLKKYSGISGNVFSCIDIPTQWGMRTLPKGFFNPFEGQIHSGKLMQNLIQLCQTSGVILLNGYRATSISEQTTKVIIEGELFDIQSEQVLICTNGFAAELLPELDVHPARGQVLVTSPLPQLSWTGTFHHFKGFDYFRNVGNRVLIGGGRHMDMENENSSEMLITPKIRDYLEHILSQYILPEQAYEIEFAWAGVMGKGKSKSPIVRNLSDRVAVAVRMGGMGVAIGTKVAQKAVELLH